LNVFTTKLKLNKIAVALLCT